MNAGFEQICQPRAPSEGKADKSSAAQPSSYFKVRLDTREAALRRREE